MIKKYNEHIAYLQDDEEENYRDPNEIIPIVGLPSGLYNEITWREYQKNNLSSLITWSEKYKCYVYRDKDYPVILKSLDLELDIKMSDNFVENVMKSFKIKNYKVTNKGIIVYEDVYLRNLDIKTIPVKLYKIHGDFVIQNVKLSSMYNFPFKVEGNFICHSNDLVSLTYGPSEVELMYDCSHNRLESLYGAPMEVNSFDCSYNRLKSLLHGPSIANSDFDCSHNEIRSLRDAPISVSGTFDCSHNELINFNGMPRDTKKIIKNNNKIF